MVVSNIHRGWPGGALSLAEPVQVGDVLGVGAKPSFEVHVVQVSGTGPYVAVIGSPWPGAGYDRIPRHVLAGEPVEVVGHFGPQEQR